VAITKTTVDLLRAAWTQGVQEVLDRELDIVKNSLVLAKDPATIATLQGKALSYIAMSKFPEYIANFVEEEVPK
jgi:hypothetical protein